MGKPINHIASQIELSHTRLEEDSTALYAFMDLLAERSTPAKGVDERTTALCLMGAAPRMEALLTVILRDLDSNLENLGAAFNLLCGIIHPEQPEESEMNTPA